MTSLSWMPNPTRQTRAHATTGKANTSVWGGIRVGLVALALLTLLRRRPSEAARRLKLDGPSRAPGPIRDGTDHGTRRDNQASALLPLVLAAGSRQGGQSHWRWRCFRMRSSWDMCISIPGVAIRVAIRFAARPLPEMVSLPDKSKYQQISVVSMQLVLPG